MNRVVALLLLAFSPVSAGLPALIPMPREIQTGEGRLKLPQSCPVACEDPADAARWIQVLREAGLQASMADARASAPIRLVRGAVKNPHGFDGAYRIEVAADHVLVTSTGRNGFIHAAETLRQWIDAGSLTRATVQDWPAFPIRGFMLDTGRNFQTPDLVKEQIEVMARYKLNIFHFHFTDHPGWRLESRIHPKVTDPASMTRQPGACYTREQFKDLIGYCRERGITLIPEMDMPGHSSAFRKALGIRSMNAPESRAILKDLITEMASLASPAEMPYIHLGNDEVRDAAEKVDATFLPEMAAHVRSLGREVIGWRPGIDDPSDRKRITQLWARANPLPQNPFIDSRSTYINHMDPFECVSTFLFQQSCRRPHGDDRALGGVLCSWPDIRIGNQRDQLRQNPAYPSMLTFAESLWRGVETDDREAYWANLPPPGSPEFERFREFEGRLLDHKNRFFEGREFPYHRQTDLRWRILGPLPHGGDVNRSFEVEKELRESYQIDGVEHRWMDRRFGAATVYLKHFFGFGAPVIEAEGTCYALTHIWSPKEQEMPAWIGFHGSSRSDRRGATIFHQGEWHAKKPWIRINGSLVPPPLWENASPLVKDDETPFTNEDYFFREPTRIHLKRGWNEILIKVPHRKSDWKWMFTFIPIGDTRGLRYSDALQPPP